VALIFPIFACCLLSIKGANNGETKASFAIVKRILLFGKPDLAFFDAKNVCIFEHVRNKVPEHCQESSDY